MPATAAAPTENLDRPQGVMHRSLSGEIRRVRMDGEGEDAAHRYEFRASSEEAVEMWPGVMEVLDHGAEAVRLDWLASGNAPALKMHDRYSQVGVVEKAAIEGRSVAVTVRVSPSQKDLIADLEAGIIRNVSIGYRVHAEFLEKRETDDEGYTTRATWRVTDWEPTEVSFVSIPADRSVGLGRAEDDDLVKRRVKFLEDRLRAETNTTMPTEAPTTTEPARAENPPSAPASAAPKAQGITAADRADIQKEERARVAGILAAAEKARASNLGDHADTAQKFISEGRSVGDFNQHVLDNIPQGGNVSQRDLGVSEKEAKRYDLNKVINGMARGDMRGCEYELEVSDAVKERNGKDNDRVAIPLDVLMRGYIPRDSRQRDLVSVTLSSSGQTDTGSKLVETDLLAEMFIESLRESTPVLGLGVTMIPGLTGDVSIPKELLTPDFYWVAEDAEPTEGDATFGSVDLEFKTVAARIPFTRQAMKQTTPNLEGVLTRSLRIGLGIAIESAIINGAGSSTVPQGVLGMSGIGDVTTGGTVTLDDLLALEEALGNANANVASAVTVTNSRGKRRLFSAKKDAGSGVFLAERDGAGRFMTDIGPGVVSNNVPSNLTDGGDPATLDRSAIIHGVWRSYVVAMWGGVELARDTATKAPTGGVVLRVFQDLDGTVARAGEFAAIQDLS